MITKRDVRATMARTLLCAAAVSVAGCAPSSQVALPDLKRQAADSMMTPAQQQKAIADMASKKPAEEPAVVKILDQPH